MVSGGVKRFPRMPTYHHAVLNARGHCAQACLQDPYTVVDPERTSFSEQAREIQRRYQVETIFPYNIHLLPRDKL